MQNTQEERESFTRGKDFCLESIAQTGPNHRVEGLAAHQKSMRTSLPSAWLR